MYILVFLFLLCLKCAVTLSWSPNKTQVMALRDLPVDIAKMKGKLFRLDDITTCGAACASRKDCKEGFMCSNCIRVGPLFSVCA